MNSAASIIFAKPGLPLGALGSLASQELIGQKRLPVVSQAEQQRQAPLTTKTSGLQARGCQSA